MSYKQLLFSFQGRVGRKVFWLWNLFYYLSITGFSIGVNTLFPAYAYLILPVFLIFVMIPDLAITAKRWHDRGKSNLWLLLNVPLMLGRLFVPGIDPSAMTEVTTLQMISSIAALVCGLWILIECGLLKGEGAENRFGSAPQ